MDDDHLLALKLAQRNSQIISFVIQEEEEEEEEYDDYDDYYCSHERRQRESSWTCPAAGDDESSQPLPENDEEEPSIIELLEDADHNEKLRSLYGPDYHYSLDEEEDDDDGLPHDSEDYSYKNNSSEKSENKKNRDEKDNDLKKRMRTNKTNGKKKKRNTNGSSQLPVKEGRSIKHRIQSSSSSPSSTNRSRQDSLRPGAYSMRGSTVNGRANPGMITPANVVQEQEQRLLRKTSLQPDSIFLTATVSSCDLTTDSSLFLSEHGAESKKLKEYNDSNVRLQEQQKEYGCAWRLMIRMFPCIFAGKEPPSLLFVGVITGMLVVSVIGGLIPLILQSINAKNVDDSVTAVISTVENVNTTIPDQVRGILQTYCPGESVMLVDGRTAASSADLDQLEQTFDSNLVSIYQSLVFLTLDNDEPQPPPTNNNTTGSALLQTTENNLNLVPALCSPQGLALLSVALFLQEQQQQQAQLQIDGDALLVASTGEQLLQERYILSVLFFATDGFQWNRNDDWLSGHHSPCKWWGVECNNQQQGEEEGGGSDAEVIVGLSLTKNNLIGTLPEELYQLTQLRRLEITNPQMLEGTLSVSILNLVHLESLHLVETGIFIPSSSMQSSSPLLPQPLFTSLSKLTSLDLRFNRLQEQQLQQNDNVTVSSRIFPENSTLPETLKELRIDLMYLLNGHENNNKNVMIPPELGELTRLETLQLEGTLNGPLPTFIVSLPNLHSLLFTSGGISGSFSDTILMNDTNKTNWKVLDLRLNQLTGTIPSSIGRLDRLESFRLSDNRLTGTIPAEIGQCASLQYLHLSGCRSLIGMLPMEVQNLSALEELHIDSTQLMGSFPALQIQPLNNLRSFWIADSEFSGIIPKDFCNAASSPKLQISVDCSRCNTELARSCFSLMCCGIL